MRSDDAGHAKAPHLACVKAPPAALERSSGSAHCCSATSRVSSAAHQHLRLLLVALEVFNRRALLLIWALCWWRTHCQFVLTCELFVDRRPLQGNVLHKQGS